MAKITKTEEEVRQQNVAEAVSKTELFFKENGKLIYSCVIAVLVIALCIRRIPYTIRSSVAVLQQIPITVEEAAMIFMLRAFNFSALSTGKADATLSTFFNRAL